MQARLFSIIENIRGGFWFLPAVMAAGAVVLSVVTISIDQSGTPSWLLHLRFIFMNQPGGAQSLLSTIAGSLISVAGVVFSLTIVSLTLASQQFGPRLMGNFMRDRGNQVVLGIFISTFLYCLLVLRTVRGEGDERDAFVPHLSVTTALLLAVVTLAATIYFIHHIASSIQVENVIGKIANALTKRIEGQNDNELFPAGQGRATSHTELPDRFEAISKPIPSPGEGYLQAVDGDGLLSLATKQDAVIRLRYRPGAFLLRGQVVADVYPGARADEVEERFGRYLTFGVGRTPAQDIESLFDQFVELALRALSPAANDPFTAISCVNRISAGLLALDRRELPPGARANEEGELRLVIPPFDYPGLATRAFSSLRSYAAADLMTAQHLLTSLANLRHELQRSDSGDDWNGGAHGRLIAALELEHDFLLASCREGLDETDFESLDRPAGKAR